MEYQSPKRYGRKIDALLDDAFSELQHDTGECDPERHHQREVLAAKFRKSLKKDEGVEPLETVKFANGMAVTLDEEGRLFISAIARGLHRIAIFPSSDNSCRIEPLGRLRESNAEVKHER